MWFGGGGGNNSVADFDLGNANDAISIIGGNFEGSARLLLTGGPSSGAWPVLIQGVRWASDGLNPDGRVIDYGYRGPLNLYNNLLGSDGGESLVLYLDARGTDNAGIAIGNHIRTSVSNPFSGTASARWVTWGNSVNTTGSFAGVSNFISPRIQPDGGGFKHARVPTGSIEPSSSEAVTLKWATRFSDSAYTLNCSVVVETKDTNGLRIDHIESVSPESAIIWVENEDPNATKNGMLHCIAVHD